MANTKTFYKKKPTEKIFFTPGIKMKSYAFGKNIHNDFVSWRKHFLEKWNSPKSNFYVLESGSIDGNYAKINKVGEFGVASLERFQKGIAKKSGSITPLWLDDFYFEVGEYGELIVNGTETDTILIDDVKAWGIDVAWTKNNGTSYTMFVFGNNDKGTSELRGYKMNLGSSVSLSQVCSMTFENTLSRKSSIYCMGSHIFLISESKLNYFYYNSDFSRLEEVAIDTDEPNSKKEFCSDVDPFMVCDAGGCVFWKSSNKVYFFPIGYPRKLRCIDLGEGYDISGIQTFRDVLYLYCKSKITKESFCNSYTIASGEIRDMRMFNREVKYNLFYAEKNGYLHYLKISPGARYGYVARTTSSGEFLGNEIDITGVDQYFCVNGDLYCGYSYVSTGK